MPRVAPALPSETGTGPKIFYISAQGQTDSNSPVNENVSALVWFRRDLERPAALGLLGAAVAITGGAVSDRRAAMH